MIWVAPLLTSPRSSHRFIEMARTLVEDEATVDLAIVAAQIHLELHIKALITSTVADDTSPLRHVLIDDDGHTWGPQHPMAKALLKALFGVDPAKDYPRWQDYTDHLKRRNAISHRGQTVSAADAEASIAVVDDLWLWLNAAAGSSSSAGSPPSPAGLPRSAGSPPSPAGPPRSTGSPPSPAGPPRSTGSPPSPAGRVP